MSPGQQTSRWSAARSKKRLNGFYLDQIPGAIRELQSDCFLERFLNSYKGQLSLVNAAFCELEENFIQERETLAWQAGKTHPISSTHDLLMLQIRRNSLAAILCREMKPQLEAYIIERSRMPLELPELADTWDKELSDCLEGLNVAA